MLGTLQHVLILQKKRRRRQSYQPPLGDQPQNSVSRTQLRAKSGDHHRGVENDPSHLTSYRMSHCMGYFNLDRRCVRKMLPGVDPFAMSDTGRENTDAWSFWGLQPRKLPGDFDL